MNKKKKLKYIGRWKELIALFAPDPSWFVDPFWDVNEKEKVLKHLKNSPGFVNYAFNHYWGWCRFKCKHYDENRWDGYKTDGTYIWPSDLEHYIEMHHIRLPQQVVEDMLNPNRVPILTTPVGFEDELEIDGIWWNFQKGRQQTYIEMHVFRGLIHVEDKNVSYCYDEKIDLLKRIISMNHTYAKAAESCITRFTRDRGLLLRGYFEGDVDSLLLKLSALDVWIKKVNSFFNEDMY